MNSSLSAITRRDLLAVGALGLAAGAPGLARAAAPAGQLIWGVHVSLAPIWFDPAETQALVTPFMVLYALHDGMVKSMPSSAIAAPTRPRSRGRWRRSKRRIPGMCASS